MSVASSALADRLARIRAAIDRAAGGRAVTLVAASKFQPLSALVSLYHLGVRDFGENYPQALTCRAKAMAQLGLSPRWHLLGGLQRNKAKRVAPCLHVAHAIDGAAVATALSAAHAHAAREPPIEVFVQVAMGPPSGARRGVDAALVPDLAAHVRALPGLRLVGLMGLPPPDAPPQAAFARLAALSASWRGPGGPLQGADGLSMGMSDDFSLAIAEGATVVRIGSALFGPRQTPA